MPPLRYLHFERFSSFSVLSTHLKSLEVNHALQSVSNLHEPPPTPASSRGRPVIEYFILSTETQFAKYEWARAHRCWATTISHHPLHSKSCTERSDRRLIVPLLLLKPNGAPCLARETGLITSEWCAYPWRGAILDAHTCCAASGAPARTCCVLWFFDWHFVCALYKESVHIRVFVLGLWFFGWNYRSWLQGKLKRECTALCQYLAVPPLTLS